MIHGMSADKFQMLDELVVQPLKALGAEVYIFGSRATGTHHPYSDVDLLYSSSIEIPGLVLSKIKEAIEESRFPFIVEIVSEKELAPSYRDNILKSRKQI